MHINFYKDNKKDFANDALDILCESEAQNNVLIKIALGFKNGEDKEDWYCATVKDNNGGIITIAVCTPPHNLVIYETGNKHNAEAINFLARELFNAGYTPPGVLGDQATAEAFAEIYAEIADKNKKNRMTLNAMQLFEVSKIKPAPGYMREIIEEDIYFVPYWIDGFHIDCNIQPQGNLSDNIETFKNNLGKNKIYIWVDKTPVSMAAFTRETFNGAVIARVYTPPFYRGNGYCTALMAQLSQNLLDRGYKYCCLFADADYPESNKVYLKVGYKNICLYSEIKFEDKV